MRCDLLKTEPVPDANPSLPKSPLDIENGQQLVLGAPVSLRLCGLDSWRWGLDSSGQLGAATPSSPAPGGVYPYPGLIYASDLLGFQAVSAGSAHTCALQYGGAVYCWGANDMGQLGLGNTSTEVGYPMQVQNLSGVTLTSLGGSHSCALVKDGSIACWGDNTNGQLGVRDNIQRDVPATVHFF